MQRGFLAAGPQRRPDPESGRLTAGADRRPPSSDWVTAQVTAFTERAVADRSALEVDVKFKLIYIRLIGVCRPDSAGSATRA
jgi:hypothetical protein